MEYISENSKIRTEACELNICYHCNLKCNFCSHLSDRMDPFFLDEKQIRRDLSTLANFYSPDYVRIVGGEPLLHPRIMNVVEEIRNSNIAMKIRVLTNGILLNQMPDRFWKNVDEIHISIYPDVHIRQKHLLLYKNKATRFGTILKTMFFDFFRASYSDLGTDDIGLIRRIYSTCQIAHIWRCHNIDNGFFYKCPQSLFIPKGIGPCHWDINNDRLRIRRSYELHNELLKFLNSTEPLNSCSHCLGSVGILYRHTLSAGNRHKPQTTEELVDWNFLKTLEKYPSQDNGCTRFGI